MSFDPRSPIGGPYHLAIASESGNRPLSIVDATSESTIRKAYMHDRGVDEHEGGGARSARYSSDGALLASLGMDGRVVIWDVSDEDDPTIILPHPPRGIRRNRLRTSQKSRAERIP